MIMAGPAGAANACDETMNPAASGNSSGLVIGCTFDSTGTASSLTITDYADAVWHYGAARNVNVTVTRTGGTAGTTAGQTTIKSRPTNNTALASCAGSPAGQTGIPAGNLAIGAADINHSIENAASTPAHAGIFINPGSFIKAVVASGTGCTQVITVTLSQPTLAGGPLCPASPGPATGSCANSVGANVQVDNGTGRAVKDGVTTAGSSTVTSASAHFLANDVGKGLSGGDLPDGATISLVNSVTSVTLVCTNCVGGFTGVTAHSALVLTLSPANPPTSARYVTDFSEAVAGRTITSASAEFSPSDVGLPVIFTPAIAGLAGARIGTTAADGSTATLAGGGTANITTGAHLFTLGLPTKTAPATGDVGGTLAILLKVNPTVSPTSPPCAANKVSGFQIPLLWKNPGAYNTVVAGGSNQFSGTSPAATSVAQFDFNTAPTSFSGYLEQHYTTTGGVQGPSLYKVHYTFLPITVGLCPGTGDATTFSFSGLSLKIAQNPSFTGGGGGGERGITAEPQGTSHTYQSSNTPPDGATVVSGAAAQPTNTNACTVSSPALLQVGC
jgi:hypothetical protein